MAMAAHQQIFSLDVAELSDRLDLTQQELLVALDASAGGTKSSQNAAAYAACLVVSRGFGHSDAEACEVLARSLKQLTKSRLCRRIVVSVTNELLHPRVVETVRSIKREISLSDHAPRIDVLQGEGFDISAVQHACMYLEATATAGLSAQSPLVIIRVEKRVFDTGTVEELVHQLRNAAILTDGLTRAVVLADTLETHSSVGIWVCSGDSCLVLVEGKADPCGKGPEEDVDNKRAETIDGWLQCELGILHCETIFATHEFNWDEVDQATGKAPTPEASSQMRFTRRFPIEDPMDKQLNDEEHDTGSSTMALIDGPSALSEIRAALDHDGISASLFPIRTTTSYDSEAPASSSSPCAVLNERSPLLGASRGSYGASHDASEKTVLSEIDLEGSKPPAELSSTTQAFLIRVERTPSSTADAIDEPPMTELVLALPENLRQMIDEDSDDEGDTKSRQRGDRLPSGITQLTLEAVVLEPPPSKLGPTTNRRVSMILHIEKQVPVIGYLILIGALFAVSSQGAVLELLVGVPPLLKLFWRVSGVALTLLPFAGMSMYKKGLPKLTREKKLLFACCVASYATYNSTFLVALSLTSIGHVYIFANSHSIIMVVGKLVLRHPLGALELLGAALGFSGGVITTLDHGHATTDATATGGKLVIGPSTEGDLIAFAGAFAGVTYLLCAKKLRAALGVRVFLFLLATGVASLLLPVLIIERERIGIDLWQPTHPQSGLMGWVHHLDIEAYIVIVGSIVGTMGFIASLKYFEPLVVSVTMLTEPVVATVISIFVGVEQVPGWPTFVGGAIVIAGCLLVLLASHKTSTKVDVSDRLVRTPFTSAVTVLRSTGDQRRISVVQASGSKQGSQS